MSQLAEIERNRIKDRTAAGRDAARAALAATGRTHRGKDRIGGAPKAADAAAVNAWRAKNAASIAATAKHFDISPATVKRYANEAKHGSEAQ